MQIRHRSRTSSTACCQARQRQTTDIVIERDGWHHRATRRRGMTPEQVDETVFSRRLWIYRNLAEWRDLNSTRVVREWVNGESFLYLGSAYRLLLVAEQDEPVKLKDGRFCLVRSVVDAGRKGRRRKTPSGTSTSGRGQGAIGAAGEALSRRASACNRARFQVKELGYRWASSLVGGGLHFHWKCLMAPAQDHRLHRRSRAESHAHHRDHTDLFWNEVDKVMPDHRERKEWLRQRGAGMDL